MLTEYGGYMGKILRIDLTSETAEEYPFTDQQRRETLGGKTLAYRILADWLTGEKTAFSEENLLIFSTGPLTGTGAPGSARFEITAISPKTLLPISSNCGGTFGVLLKKAGFDALILHGRCKAHRWLEVTENDIRFHDAGELWGTGTAACFRYLTRRNSGQPFDCLCIGPAGEELLPGAAVVSGDRCVGKAGFGAVLGRKNLKAITVSGRKTIPLYDPVKTMEEVKNWNRHIQQNLLTSDPEKISSCPGCSIRCKTKESLPDPILIDLGLDALDAPEYMQWMYEKLGSTPELPPVRKHGQRRNKLYQAILQTMGLQDCERSFGVYQNLSEAIGALGLCLFTVGASAGELTAEILTETVPEEDSDRISIYPVRLFHDATGCRISLGKLLSIGQKSRQLQKELQCRMRNE